MKLYILGEETDIDEACLSTYQKYLLRIFLVLLLLLLFPSYLIGVSTSTGVSHSCVMLCYVTCVLCAAKAMQCSIMCLVSCGVAWEWGHVSGIVGSSLCLYVCSAMWCPQRNLVRFTLSARVSVFHVWLMREEGYQGQC